MSANASGAPAQGPAVANTATTKEQARRHSLTAVPSVPASRRRIRVVQLVDLSGYVRDGRLDLDGENRAWELLVECPPSASVRLDLGGLRYFSERFAVLMTDHLADAELVDIVAAHLRVACELRARIEVSS